jgi:hypothetical protein
MKKILSEGGSYPLTPIDDDFRQEDNEFHLQRGNHKSALKHHDKLRAIVHDDVRKGFSLPLRKEAFREIPHSVLASYRMVEQGTIDELAREVSKVRATHDQYLPGPSGLSVNRRVMVEFLAPLVFGFALQRFIHYIVSCRWHFPNQRILLGKFDWKSAYKGAHLRLSTAVECMTCFEDLSFMALRYTFGGRPCPSDWCSISESVCDLANELIQDPNWDHISLKSCYSGLLPEPERIESSVPFARAQPLAFMAPVNLIGSANVFIDDMLTACVDIVNNAERCTSSVALAMDAVGRRLDHDEPLPCDTLLSLSKLKGEGQMSEVKVTLGWELHSRILLVSLSQDKFELYFQDIQKFLDSGYAPRDPLKTTVGRLEHAATIVPEMRHFLGRIRRLKDQICEHDKKGERLSRTLLTDLILTQKILHYARDGVSLNRLTHRKRSIWHRSDAAEHGIGGMNIWSAVGWRIFLPPRHRYRLTLNTLEFLASVVTVWIDVLAGRAIPESCFLAETDSTTGAGWLHKSNFAKEYKQAQLRIARKYAELLMDSGTCLYSQHIKGKHIGVTDSLSRDHNLDNEELTSLLYFALPLQMPPNFNINPVPNEISSFVTSVILDSPVTKLLSQTPIKSTKLLGPDGASIPHPSDLQTHGYSSFLQAKNKGSLGVLPKPSAKEDTPPPPEKTLSPRERCALPWTALVRPLRPMTCPTRDLTTKKT